MTELCDLTATELLEGYAARSWSPVDVVESCLARIDAVEPVLNAVRYLRRDDALADAAASAHRWAAGTARPLEGVPYGLKDIIATAGLPTTGGSALHVDHVPTQDAAHAARLSAAGGVLLAKLETFEFACGGPFNKTFGAVRNPWDVERTTGGSSSGSGSAVAAGMMPLAIGTDTGGSIRIPAAYCGLTGIKPTYGRVPRHGVMGLSWTLDHVGPMARSAEDCALMLSVIAGHHPGDPMSSRQPVPDYTDMLAQVPTGRIGRLRGWFEEMATPEVLAALDDSAAVLVELGYEIVDVELPDVALASAAAWQVCYAETLSYQYGNFAVLDDRDEMGAGMVAAAPFVSAADYLRALRYRSVFQQHLEAALDGCIALLLVGAAAPAPKLDDLADPAVAAWLGRAVRDHMPFNYAGVPAVCVPNGLIDGVPSSMQLVGMPQRDGEILALARRFQSATEHHRARPAMLLTEAV